MGRTPLPGNWALRAACRGWPTSWWYPVGEDPTSERTPREKHEDAESARRICRACPVAGECLAHALRYYELGIWSALDETDRRRLYERLRKPRQVRRRESVRWAS